MSSITRRYFLRTGVLTASVGAAAQAMGPFIGRAATRELVVVGYGGAYQEAERKAIFTPFEKETGIKVIDTSPTDYGKLKAMVASGNVEWDLVNGGDRMVPAGTKEGLLEPLDYQTIDTRNVYPQVVHKYGVGNSYYSTVLGHSTKKYAAGEHPKSWGDFWDVKRFPGPRTLRKNPVSTLEFALLADGVPMEKLYPLDVDRAFKSLDRISKHVTIWWTTGAQPAQALVDGEVDLAALWNGRIATIMKEGARAGFEWNQGQLGWGAWMVPKGSRSRDAAMKFIAFGLQPKAQAALAHLIPYGPVNKKAFDLIDARTASDLPSSPDNVRRQFMLDAGYWGENLTSLTERWTTWFIR